MMPSDKAGRITQRWFHRRLSPVHGGGANERMPTAFEWAHASWDNAQSKIPHRDRLGRQLGDGDHPVGDVKPSVRGSLGCSNVPPKRLTRRDLEIALSPLCSLGRACRVLPTLNVLGRLSGDGEQSELVDNPVVYGGRFKEE